MANKKNKSSSNQNKQTHTYTTAYSKKDYSKDEKQFNKSEKDGKIDWSSFKRLLMYDLCTNTNVIDTGCVGDINLEDVTKALKYPNQCWKTLMDISEELMRVSPHYYRLNNYYSNMVLFCWGVDLYDVKESANIESIKKAYGLLAAKLENMHLKHEFSKIMKYLPYQDIYCGLIVESTTDFFFQKINYNICQLYQVQDGLYNFRIDLSAIKKDISAYPDYVQQAYIDYFDCIKNDKKVSKWYSPPPDKQICLKLNWQWTHPYPILIGLVRDILDLDVYKKLKLQSARTDNYKAIMIKVPIDETTVDKPLLTPDTLGIFAEINRESMTDDIGIIHTLGSDGEAISFKDSNNTTNNVSDAVDELYNSSGESRELYNGSSSGTAVTFSVENDSGFVYGLYRQFERWTNRYIKLKKYSKSTFKFYFYLLDITIFNRDTVSKRYKDACTLGAPVVDKWLATLDMTPSRTLGSYITHNEVFDFYNKLKPLSSSYNASTTESTVGRPSSSETGELLSEEGEKTKDGDKNDR